MKRTVLARSGLPGWAGSDEAILFLNDKYKIASPPRAGRDDNSSEVA